MKHQFWEDAIPDDLRTAIDIGHETIIDLLTRSIEKAPELPAFSMEEVTISFAELGDFSDRIARFLLRLPDVNPGDRILIQLPNSLAFPIVVFGALKAGLILVPCNPLYTQHEVQRIIDDCSPKVAVSLGFNIPSFKKSNIPYLITSRIFDFKAPMKGLKVELYGQWQRKLRKFNFRKIYPLTRILQKKVPLKKPLPAIEDTDTALLQYTGGSSGVMKGAKLTHRNIIANVKQLRRYLGDNIVEGQEIAITILPLYHIFSFTVHCMTAVFTSNHTVLIVNPTDLRYVIDEMSRWRFTTLSGLNTLFSSLLKNSYFQKLDFSALKLTISGGMKLDTQIAEKWLELTQCQIIEGFGMSETSPVISLNHPSHNRLGTVGFPIPNTAIKLVDQRQEQITSFEQEGEIWVKGPQVCHGYWNNPQEDQSHFREDWLKTGDKGKFCPSGQLQITGRIKDMIIVSGFNVYPQEVIEVLSKHPDIVESHVVGIPHTVSGEIVKAEIKVKQSSSLTAGDVKSFCRKYLTSYKIPRKIIISRI